MGWFGKTYKHKCPDGSIKIVYKNIDDAFPLFLPGWEGKISGNVKGLENVNIGAKSGYATKIQGLLYNLDELNESLMMQFRGAYVTYQTDPCKNEDFLHRQIQNILDEQTRLKTLKIKIEALVSLAELNKNNNPVEIISIFKGIVNEIGGNGIADVAEIEINETRQIAQKMRGDENDS